MADTPATQPAGRDVVVRSNWLVVPSADDLGRYYPKAAAAAAISGRVTLVCWVETDTTVTGCRVQAEDPPGLGFGAAALLTASVFRLSPQTVNGIPTPSEVRVPVYFNIDAIGTPTAAVAAPNLAEAEARDPQAVADARAIAGKLAETDMTMLSVAALYRSWMSDLFKSPNTSPSPHYAEAFARALARLAAARQDRMAAALATKFTRPQLKEILGFLETPTGIAFAGQLGDTMVLSHAGDKELVIAMVDAWQADACGTAPCSERAATAFTTIRTFFQSSGPPVGH